jgi:hypothetical protein
VKKKQPARRPPRKSPARDGSKPPQNICINTKCKLRSKGCKGFEGCPGFLGKG